MTTSVAIITPTIGTNHLSQCIASVQNQSHTNIKHYIVCDGHQYLSKVKALTKNHHEKIKLITLPENTGANKYYGHRIYGAIPFLVNADYIVYLDEDNWLEPDHILHLCSVAYSEKLEWAYSLRKIYSRKGDYLCDDNCHSLGHWHSWHRESGFIDTSCYFMKTSLAVKASPIWYRQGYLSSTDPDRALHQWLVKNGHQGACSGLHTVNYRLGSSADSPPADFFTQGNHFMAKRLAGDPLPWLKRTTLAQKTPRVR